ncbi:UNKNOWN [Stylonychia lemnae]|uniref:Uncharacterized protein n=1 Tax=Stylonychia lemnae TaxID=5949 RepID=A0A078B3P9_STYLE|nr:UNKNOWN [Stylonychia lemnae]|eukprot:CDW87847.1 UNKNOWN [Stylonychia lemnae]
MNQKNLTRLAMIGAAGAAVYYMSQKNKEKQMGSQRNPQGLNNPQYMARSGMEPQPQTIGNVNPQQRDVRSDMQNKDQKQSHSTQAH